MTALIRYLLDPQFVVMALAGVAAFATVVSFVLPLLSGDRLGSRMKYVASERERLRAETMTRLAEAQYRGRLRTEPKTYMQKVVKQLNLRKALETEATRERLSMAGLRGQAPVVAFLFFRAALPVVTFGLTFFYVYFLNTHPLQPLVKLCLSIVGAYVGFYLPNVFVSNLIARRQTSIKRVFPDALDLLLICVQAGMSVEAAMNKVASEIAPRSLELAEEFSLTTAELSYLPERRQAYENLGRRTGIGVVRAVGTSLIQAERYGTAISQALRVLAKEARDTRMAEAEKKAAALGTQAHRANDPVLSAGAVHRDHGAGLHSRHGRHPQPLERLPIGGRCLSTHHTTGAPCADDRARGLACRATSAPSMARDCCLTGEPS